MENMQLIKEILGANKIDIPEGFITVQNNNRYQYNAPLIDEMINRVKDLSILAVNEGFNGSTKKALATLMETAVKLALNQISNDGARKILTATFTTNHEQAIAEIGKATKYEAMRACDQYMLALDYYKNNDGKNHAGEIKKITSVLKETYAVIDEIVETTSQEANEHSKKIIYQILFIGEAINDNNYDKALEEAEKALDEAKKWSKKLIYNPGKNKNIETVTFDGTVKDSALSKVYVSYVNSLNMEKLINFEKTIKDRVALDDRGVEIRTEITELKNEKEVLDSQIADLVEKYQNDEITPEEFTAEGEYLSQAKDQLDDQISELVRAKTEIDRVSLGTRMFIGDIKNIIFKTRQLLKQGNVGYELFEKSDIVKAFENIVNDTKVEESIAICNNVLRSFENYKDKSIDKHNALRQNQEDIKNLYGDKSQIKTGARVSEAEKKAKADDLLAKFTKQKAPAKPVVAQPTAETETNNTNKTDLNNL